MSGDARPDDPVADPATDPALARSMLSRETAALTADIAALGQADLVAPSRCEGWSRGHVLAHLARNADAIGNLAAWARTGVEHPMYASEQSRDEDIRSAAERPIEVIRVDVEQSSAALTGVLAGLSGGALERVLTVRGGRTITGAALPMLRLQEVVFHHVDLLTEYSFDDADPGLVRSALGSSVCRLAHREPDLEIRLELDPAQDAASRPGFARLGVAGGTVCGSPAALLLWLARGDGCGVSTDGALPALPSWG